MSPNGLGCKGSWVQIPPRRPTFTDKYHRLNEKGSPGSSHFAHRPKCLNCLEPFRAFVHRTIALCCTLRDRRSGLVANGRKSLH